MNMTTALTYHEENCAAVYELFLEENRLLRDFGSLSDSYLARKGEVLEQVDRCIDTLREIRAAGAQQQYRESILRMRTTIMKILTLDRENERLLLGKSAADATTSMPAPAVGRTYQQYSR